MDHFDILGRVVDVFFKSVPSLPTEAQFRVHARNVANLTLKGTRLIVLLLTVTLLSTVISAFGVWFTTVNLLKQLDQENTIALTRALGICVAVILLGLVGLYYGLSMKRWEKVIQQDQEEDKEIELKLADERRRQAEAQSARNREQIQSLVVALANEFLQSRRDHRAARSAPASANDDTKNPD